MKTPARSCLAAVSLILLCGVLPTRADYSNTVASFNPRGYWRFNETAASPALNKVVNASTLGSVLDGYVILDATKGEAGIVGNSVRFINAGVSATICGSKVDVPFSYALNPSGPFSVELWVKPNALGSDTTGMALFSSMSGDFASSARVGYLMYMDNTGRFEWRLGNLGGYAGVVKSPNNAAYNATVGLWRHVVGVFDGTQTRIYVNGTNVANSTLTAATIAALLQNSQSSFRMGGTPFNGSLSDYPLVSAGGVSGNRGIDGWLDELAVYNYALTTNQCAAHFAAAATNTAGYSAQILADNPVGYWPMNDAAQTAPNTNTYVTVANSGSVGSAANGKVVWGGLTAQSGSSNPGFGAGNNAVLLDGANGYVKIPSAAGLDFSGNITMMAWVKPQVKNFFRDIIARGWDGNTAETFLRIARGTDLFGTGYGITNHYEVGATDAAGTAYDSALAVMPEGDIGNWVFIAGTYDGAAWRLYRNGQQVATKTSANGALINADAWTIGAQANADIGGDFAVPGGISTFFGGSIDEPAIFNTALSATDINNIYQAAQVKPVITRSLTTPTGYVKDTWPLLFKGRSATLSVWAEGSPTLSYQWYSNGIPLGVTATNLNLVDMKAGTPTFSVIVTNLYGSATSSVTLNIGDKAPFFTAQPIPLARFAGTPFSFSATVGGSLPVGFVWNTNGTVIPGSASSGVNVGNETVSTYTGTASAANAFNYSATATNAAGTTNSAAAALIVFPAATGYAASVLSNSPIAYWRLGETNGTTAYDYIGANNGTYFNPTLNQPGYSSLDPDRAAGFGAVNNYVGNISGTAINFEGTNVSFSIECWANGPAGQSDQSAIICKGTGDSGTTANEQFAIDVAFGNYRFMTRGNGGTIYQASANIGPNGTWQHVVGVYDQTTPGSPQMYIYVNGVLAGQGPGRPAVNNGLRASTAPVDIGAKRLGNSPDRDGFFTGTIDELAIYNTALSESVVERHYGAAYGSTLAPQFTIQPTPTTNYVGLSATLSVGAVGSVPLSYQWKKVGSGDVPGATDFFLTFNSLTAGDEGTYFVTVSNPVLPGGTNSASVYLRVLPTPTNSPAIPGLVMLHRFENNLIDSTGRGNNGTAVAKTATTTNNAATPTFNPGPPGLGNAYHYQSDFGTPTTTANTFTTTNTEYATLGVRPDLQFSSNVNFTVAMWIKLPDNFIGGDLPFFTSTAGSLGGQGFVFAPAYGYGNASGTSPNPAPLNYGGWGMSLYDSGSVNGARIYGDLGSINFGWHHLVFVLDRNKQCVTYLDGNVAKSFKISGTSTAAAKTIDTGAPVTIGQDPTGIYAETGSGDIDDLAVWRRALTPLEAAQVYAAGAAGFSPAYVATVIQPTITQSLSGSTLSLSFGTETGRQYVVEWKGTLTNGVWNSLVTNAGTGGSITVPTSTVPDQQRFFRVRVQ
jgi:hypothetical protein